MPDDSNKKLPKFSVSKYFGKRTLQRLEFSFACVHKGSLASSSRLMLVALLLSTDPFIISSSYNNVTPNSVSFTLFNNFVVMYLTNLFPSLLLYLSRTHTLTLILLNKFVVIYSTNISLFDSLSLTHTYTHSHTHTLSISLSLSVTHTLTHTLTHTPKHALSYITTLKLLHIHSQLS